MLLHVAGPAEQGARDGGAPGDSGRDGDGAWVVELRRPDGPDRPAAAGEELRLSAGCG